MFEEIKFPGQHENEKIILFLRRHWFIFFMRILFILIAIVALVTIYVFFSTVNSNFKESAFYNLLLFGESLATLFIWNFFFILWLDFYLDAWIVTNERIINIEQRGFFIRKISELKLTKIQDVSSEIVGVIPTLFNYGNICVQTAGEIDNFTFFQIPNPNYVKNVIVDLQEKERESEEEELGSFIRGNP
ncbi:MAG: PH domain-containing protein [Candidatus Moranbacteria bacterium]|nr:PH domain-containing protein [Candidatus Moranbacteria bacterium]